MLPNDDNIIPFDYIVGTGSRVIPSDPLIKNHVALPYPLIESHVALVGLVIESRVILSVIMIGDLVFLSCSHR